MRNEGATCDNCDNKGGKIRKRCRKCATADYKPGWEPAAGVKVEKGRAYQVATNRFVDYRRVVEA
ncbi:MAG: hypothetical protein GXY34_00320 [Syntrophomonadaceae bacterium]|nr:hypothetical protein [Syntrophomonadaceae bacterium]